MVSQLCTARGGGLKLLSSQAGGAFGGARWGRAVGGQGSFPCEQCCTRLSAGQPWVPRVGTGGCHLACTRRPTQARKPAPVAVTLTQLLPGVRFLGLCGQRRRPQGLA